MDRLNNNWFKILVSLFLAGILYLGWEYVESQKQIALNGRYQISSGDYYNYGVDTRTGIIYRTNPVGEIPK